MFGRKKYPVPPTLKIGPPRTVYHDTLIAEHFSKAFGAAPYEITERRATLLNPVEAHIYQALKPSADLWRYPLLVPVTTRIVVVGSDDSRTEYHSGVETSHDHEVIV